MVNVLRSAIGSRSVFAHFVALAAFTKLKNRTSNSERIPQDAGDASEFSVRFRAGSL
jgi:hypothetical protein